MATLAKDLNGVTFTTLTRVERRLTRMWILTARVNLTIGLKNTLTEQSASAIKVGEKEQSWSEEQSLGKQKEFLQIWPTEKMH